MTALGVTQILAWGSSYYLPAVLARPIAGDTGWPLTGLVGGLSLGLLVAGAVAPRVGQAIDRDGGRPVLAFSSVLMAAGLIGIGLAQSLTVYLAAWLLIGIGMGAGLYDAAFSALGRAYGRDARTAIAALTLFGGLASTVCWPLSAWLVETVGWRGTCFAYAGLHLSLALPLHLVAVPRAGADIGPPAPGSGSPPVTAKAHLIGRGQRLVFILLAVVIAAGSAISSVLSVHLLTILQSGGVELAPPWRSAR